MFHVTLPSESSATAPETGLAAPHCVFSGSLIYKGSSFSFGEIEI
jgi:hypothetical protein